jgi:hypothetical protein
MPAELVAPAIIKFCMVEPLPSELIVITGLEEFKALIVTKSEAECKFIFFINN